MTRFGSNSSMVTTTTHSLNRNFTTPLFFSNKKTKQTIHFKNYCGKYCYSSSIRKYRKKHYYGKLVATNSRHKKYEGGDLLGTVIVIALYIVQYIDKCVRACIRRDRFEKILPRQHHRQAASGS
mmetsp:Transcript_13366/g.30846  ORF Transcript_13366/g.30846 Transcript_13366/m.30846 type:complete len:124 (-) Transcript_13366:1486-1857(-)